MLPYIAYMDPMGMESFPAEIQGKSLVWKISHSSIRKAISMPKKIISYRGFQSQPWHHGAMVDWEGKLHSRILHSDGSTSRGEVVIKFKKICDLCVYNMCILYIYIYVAILE